ncbi:gfo/Idh/MocA family oxidoreductase [Mycetocola reblochoni]|nr:gfo/Idh/MocA family oxidoreductase [Mycetocola reblochoni]
MGRVHAHAVHAAGSPLLGVLTRTPEGSRRASAELGATGHYEDLDALLDDPEVDVVHVLTPNATHRRIAERALEAGKHVVCEKPLATSVADALAIAGRAEAEGLVVAVPHFYRFHPMVREARARVASGGIGRLLTVSAGYLQDWLLDAGADDWRVDDAAGGPSRAFADIGSHLVDLVEFISGDRVARLVARTSTAHADRGRGEVRTEDAAALVIETVGGAIGTLLVSQVAAGRKNALTLELSGTDAAVAFDQERPDEIWWGTTTENSVVPRGIAGLSADAARLSTVPAGHPMGYQDAANAFVRDSYALMAGGTPDGVPTAADGVRSAVIIDAVLRSHAAGTWVEAGPAPAATETNGVNA